MIARHRAGIQQITSPRFKKVEDVVGSLGAMQAQDFAGAKWSIGLRLPGTTEADIERAIEERAIIRTWALRGTLHFVAARDIHWILTLIAPRLHANQVAPFRKVSLTDSALHKSQDIMRRVLQGGNTITRKALLQEIQDGGVSVEDIRANFILLRAAVDGVICSGPRQGKEYTFVLLDEWVKPPAPITREEALANLAKCYFKGHGPATLQDYIWWSGLSRAEAQQGMGLASKSLSSVEVDDQKYFMGRNKTELHKDTQVHMLPGFDELLLGYTDRSASLAPVFAKRVAANKNGLFAATLVSDGEVIGLWKRTLVKDKVMIAVEPLKPFSKAQHRAITQAVKRYGSFLGMAPVLEESV